MRNGPFRSDSITTLGRTLAKRRLGSQAQASLIVVVWALLWVWVAAGVLVPLSRTVPPGTEQRAGQTPAA